METQTHALLYLIFRACGKITNMNRKVAVLLFLTSLCSMAISSEFIPRYEMVIRYETHACQDTMVQVSKEETQLCKTGQTLVLSQTLTGETYVICSCKVSEHGNSLGEGFSIIPKILEDPDAGSPPTGNSPDGGTGPIYDDNHEILRHPGGSVYL